MITCQQARDAMHETLDAGGRNAPALIVEHLRQCPACSAAWADLLEAEDAVHSAVSGLAIPEPPGDLEAGVHDRLRHEWEQGAPHSRPRPWLAVALLAAAALAALVLLRPAESPVPRRAPSPPTTAQAPTLPDWRSQFQELAEKPRLVQTAERDFTWFARTVESSTRTIAALASAADQPIATPTPTHAPET